MPPQNEIIVDTGFIVALFNEKDEHHRTAIEIEQTLGDECQFLSTIFVVQETCWHLSKKGQDNVLVFLEELKNGFILLPPLPKNWVDKVVEILQTYSNLELDLADASIVVLANHINLGDIISIDYRDFLTLRWGGKKHFNNLMPKNHS